MELETSMADSGYRIYYDLVRSLMNAVLFVSADKYDPAVIKEFRRQLDNSMHSKGLNIHYFLIMLVDSTSEQYIEQITVSRQVCAEESFSWIYDTGKDELIVYEDQAEEFYGLRSLLEGPVPEKTQEDDAFGEMKEPEKVPFAERVGTSFKKQPKVTLALVFINIVVFIICTFTGNLLYYNGGVGYKLVQTPDQWYRLITSMFLHIDAMHIFSNMLLLYLLGEVVETEVKPVFFLIAYFVTGIAGSITTFISELISGDYKVVFGASGAIFGILGVLFALVMFKRVNRKTMQLGRLVIVIILSIFDGFTATNVANWSHIGGLVAGVVCGTAFCLVTSVNKSEEKSNED